MNADKVSIVHSPAQIQSEELRQLIDSSLGKGLKRPDLKTCHQAAWRINAHIPRPHLVERQAREQEVIARGTELRAALKSWFDKLDHVPERWLSIEMFLSTLPDSKGNGPGHPKEAWRELAPIVAREIEWALETAGNQVPAAITQTAKDSPVRTIGAKIINRLFIHSDGSAARVTDDEFGGAAWPRPSRAKGAEAAEQARRELEERYPAAARIKVHDPTRPMLTLADPPPRKRSRRKPSK